MKQRVSGLQDMLAGRGRPTGAGLRPWIGRSVGVGAALVLVVALPFAAPALAQDGFRVVTPVAPAPAPAPLGAPAPKAAAVTRTAASTRTAPAAAHNDTAGRYAILRGSKDTGCMLTLEAGVRGPRGSNKAVLAPACRDSGLLIFDPVGWELSQGQLVLMARKGHDTHLERQPDGTWQKDSKEGKPLTLRKI